MNNDFKDMLRLREQLGFLGYEFLTWTFLLLDRDTAKEDIASITKDVLFKDEASLVLGTKLVTCSLINKEQKTSVACPILEDSHEVFASLRNGHLIESLSLGISFGGVIVECSLHAQDFAITGLKIKSAYEAESLTDDENDLDESEKNREELFLRMAAVSDAEKIIDALFNNFLMARMNDKSFSTVVKQMRQQIEDRLGNYLKDTSAHGEGVTKTLYAIG